MNDRPHVLIGIAGGSASGKTLVADRLAQEYGRQQVVVLAQDFYYKDLSHLSVEERHGVNFDHPDAFDIDFLFNQIEALMQGEPVDVPGYDYARHNRTKEATRVENHTIVVLEGILVFYFERLRRLMDIKIFVDTPDDLRLIRRIRRDTVERGRSLESVLDQYETMVRPMYQTFCEPTKRHADIIIPEGGENTIAIDIVRAKIDAVLTDIDSRRGVSSSSPVPPASA